MLILPAIDIYQGQAVRLYKGDYSQKTVYGSPIKFAEDFKASGACAIHLVDLEGAKIGETPNFQIVGAIKKQTGLFCEIGGGIRSIDVISKYLDQGLDRVILGTKATDEDFLKTALKKYGDKIAVGIDIKDGWVAVKGWLENSKITVTEMFENMLSFGVKTVICTDVKRDGAMQGANKELYKELVSKYPLDIIASGGVSDLQDVMLLKRYGLSGAIIGKAYYNGAIDLKKAIEVAK